MRTRGHRPGALEIEVWQDEATFLIQLRGDCDMAAEAAMRDAFARAVDSACVQIVVDLELCRFFDSTGIGALVRLDRRVRGAEGRGLLVLPGPPPVQRVFELCGLLDALPFHSADDAPPDRAASADGR